MRWAISGGAGFLGLHLARRLLADGHEVRTLDLGYEVAFDPLGRMATAAYGVVLPNLEPPTPFAILVGPDGILQGFYPGPWTGGNAAAIPSYSGP